MNTPAQWQSLHDSFLRYRAGDETVVRGLFTSLEGALTGFYWTRLPNAADAEELCQSALLKIHFNRERFDETQSLKTWIFTIAGRLLIDHWRGTSDEIDASEAAQDALAQTADPGTPLALRFELNHDLRKALETLKPIDRSIVYLYGVEGLSMAEIATALGLTEGAVKLRAHRSYGQLRPLLER